MDAFDLIQPAPAAWLRDSVLAPFVPAYWSYLVDRHYSIGTARAYLCCIAHFARWTRRRHVGIDGITEEIIRSFLNNHLPRCTCPSPAHRCYREVRAALRQLVPVLDVAGVPTKNRHRDSIDDELSCFDRHMQQDRGLAESTRLRRLLVVRSLLRYSRNTDSNVVAAPTADTLRQFIAQELSRLSPGSAASLATALRSYLRFRAMQGDRVEHLIPVIMSPPCWRLAPLPKTLSQMEVAQLLNAFPAGMPSGLRAYAMVRCVVDLGLRSSEVISLELDDIDWEAATLRIVRCKSRRVDVLPLPHATGHAIAAYLRSERPATANRRVFVRHVAPVNEPVGPDVVRNAVRNAYRRCGLPYTRVHILRHTLASRLLESGGTLKEVADVLRHRQLDTSLIYAKVDTVRLSAVAMPWPGSAP